MCCIIASCVFFFFNDTATTEIYTLSLHDALPISVSAAMTRAYGMRVTWCSQGCGSGGSVGHVRLAAVASVGSRGGRDRKSTRLNSSHANISYAVFCLKKKKKNDNMSEVKNLNTKI